MKLLNKLNALKKDKKGFTLIEIVIVIVIIAILAAMLVPSMLSWIDKANQRTFLSACDTIRTSVSTVLSDNYAAGKTNLVSASDEATLKDLVGKDVKIVDSLTAATGDAYNVKVTVSANKVSKIEVASSKYHVEWNATAASGNSGWGDVEVYS